MSSYGYNQQAEEDDYETGQYEAEPEEEPGQAEEGDEEVGQAEEGDEELGQAEEGDEELGQAEGDDEVGEGEPVAAEITEITDETAGLNDEETRQEIAAAFDPNNDIPSDDEEAIKHHDFDVTLTSASGDGEMFELKGKMDTGADLNCISDEAVNEHGLPILDEENDFTQTFETGNGDHVAPLGRIVLKFFANKDEKPHTQHFHVVPGMKTDVLLGHPFIVATGAIKIQGKFKSSPEDAPEDGDEEPDVKLMSTHPSTKKEAASDAKFADSVRGLNVSGGRKGRPAPK